MTAPIWITFAILVGAVVLFLSERMRADLVALLVVAAFGLSGVLSPQEAFAGFGNPVIAALLAIFVLAEGLRLAGVADRVGRLLLRFSGSGQRRLLLLLMGCGAFLSLVMSNTAAASLLMPAASSAGRRAGVPLSRLLMPLAFATILGGMATLFTTTNLLVSGVLRDYGLVGFGLLDFLPVGLCLVLLGVAYLALGGYRLLPTISAAEHLKGVAGVDEDLVALYRLGERVWRARVPAGSSLCGKSLAQCGFRERWGATVLTIERHGRATPSPSPAAVLSAGDGLVLEAKRESLCEAEQAGILEILGVGSPDELALESATVVVAEVVLSPRSVLIGQTLVGAHFREKYGMTALALWRAGLPIRTGIRDLELRFGDALLLQGPRDRLDVLRTEPDLILLEAARLDAPVARGKGRVALVVMAASVLLVALPWPPPAVALLLGALAMIFARVLTVDQAYQCIEWRTVFLVAGMLPVSTALARSGASDLLAGYLGESLATAGPFALLAAAYGISAVLAQVMSGAVVAAVVAPVAILAAQQVGADPRAIALGVVLGSSMAFTTPLGHPVNLLVMASGGYRFRHYARVGFPLLLLLSAAVLALLPVFWPLTP